MKISTQTTKKILLELTEAEAVWLKNVMQNAINVPLEEESSQSRAYRKNFFDNLKDALQN